MHIMNQTKACYHHYRFVLKTGCIFTFKCSSFSICAIDSFMLFSTTGIAAILASLLALMIFSFSSFSWSAFASGVPARDWGPVVTSAMYKMESASDTEITERNCIFVFCTNFALLTLSFMDDMLNDTSSAIVAKQQGKLGQVSTHGNETDTMLIGCVWS
uniref:Uncharacterized protein n=1 Tax=Oryza brachyantha TaxID=4533 RepID=J3M0B7_ORYBR